MQSPKRKRQSDATSSGSRQAETSTWPSSRQESTVSSASSAQLSFGRSDSGIEHSLSRTASEPTSPQFPLHMARAKSSGRSDQPGPSKDKQRDLRDDQSLAEDYLTGTYSMLESSTARTPSVQAQSPMGMPTPAESGNIHEQEIYMILSSACHKSVEEFGQEISTAAKALVTGLLRVTAGGQASYILSIIEGVRLFAMKKPQAIDYLLKIFKEATEMFPGDISTEYGRGAAAGINRFRAWLHEESVGFRVDTSAHRVWMQDPNDQSNITFRGGNLAANLDSVLSDVEEWKKRRTCSIITAAMHGRAMALGMLRMADSRWTEDLINARLMRRKFQWSKTDFIGTCVLLRGCGQSLMARHGGTEGKEKRQELRSALEAFLLQDAETWIDCFWMKAHAALALRSLTDAVADQSSDQIFWSGEWVF